jgi:hypothetical protein
VQKFSFQLSKIIYLCIKVTEIPALADEVTLPTQASTVQKKPAGAIAPKKSVMKKPCGTQHVNVPANRFDLKPNGCSKCRFVSGCTPSCWKGRGY